MSILHPAIRLLRSGLIGVLADQAVVSFGNFALTASLARILSLTDYGAYAVTMSYLLFLNTLHQAFIVYPFSVNTASAPEHHEHHLRVALLMTPIGALLFLPVLAAALWSAGHLSLLLLVFAALLAWQVQEVVRRALLAHADYRNAMRIDSLRYLAPVALTILFAAHISVSLVFVLIALAAALSVVPLAGRVRRRWAGVIRKLPQEAARHWQLGAPILSANLLSSLTAQWFLWLFAWQDAPQNAAVLVALSNVVAIGSPVMLGVENILVPEIARERARLDFVGLMRLVARCAIPCIALLGPVFVLIALYPETTLKLVYGGTTEYAAYPQALRMLAFVYLNYLLSYILGATLRGWRAGAAFYRMQLYPALLGLTLGSWLALSYGVEGAAFAALLAGLLRVGIGVFHVLQLRNEAQLRQAILAMP